jgi:papain like cysteine protease AvrRpt2
MPRVLSVMALNHVKKSLLRIYTHAGSQEEEPQGQQKASCNYEVADPPSHVPQELMCGGKSKTCWAAAAAMMISYRDSTSYEIGDALNTVGEPYITMNRENKGLPNAIAPGLFDKIGLVPLPPIYNPQDLKAALETHGIILAVLPPKGAEPGLYHDVIFVGMRDPETSSGACDDPSILIIDPASESLGSGNNDVISFSDFKKQFYSAPSSDLYVLGKSSQQPLQSEDITGDTNQPLSPGDFQENSDEDNGSGLGDGTNTVQSEDEELREEIEDDVDECDLYPDDPFCVALEE